MLKIHVDTEMETVLKQQSLERKKEGGGGGGGGKGSKTKYIKGGKVYKHKNNSKQLSTHVALQYELLVVLKVVHDAHVRAAVHDGLPEAVRQVENWNVSVQAVGPDNVLGREKIDQSN